jgi:hypothetical protein
LSAPRAEAAPLRIQQPVKIVVDRMPAEKHDFSGDIVTGLTGLFGVFVGALLSKWIADGQRKATKAEADGEKLEAALFSITFRLEAIYGALAAINRHYSGHIEAAGEVDDDRLGLLVSPFSHQPPRVELPVTEMMLVRKVLHKKYINGLGALNITYNNLIDLLASHSEQRRALSSVMDPMEDLGGGSFNISITPEEKTLLTPAFFALTTVVKAIDEEASYDVQQAFVALAECKRRWVELFEPDGVYEILAPDGVVFKVSASGIAKKTDP